MGYIITVSHELSEFYKLEQEWENLLAESDARGFAVSWTGINTWLKHFQDTGELWLLTARDEKSDDLVGIAPLFKRKIKPKYSFAYFQLEFIGNSHNSENLGFVIRDGEKKKLIPEFITALLAQKQKWDGLLLSGIEDAETCSILNNSDLVWEQNESKEMISPVVHLPSTVEEWFLSLSRNRRSKLRGYSNKLDDEFPGEWEIKTINERDDLDEVFEHLVEYHQKKWEGKGVGGAFFYGEWVNFYHDLN